MPSVTQRKGAFKEQLALQQLKQAKLRLIQSNYHCRYGEIDLIMKDQNCIVFVEVRSRKSSCFGNAAMSINFQKQKKLIATAQHFLMQYPVWNKLEQRFDMVTFDGNQSGVWTKNIIC